MRDNPLKIPYIKDSLVNPAPDDKDIIKECNRIITRITRITIKLGARAFFPPHIMVFLIKSLEPLKIPKIRPPRML